jgi:hypothetical protein
VTLEGKTAQNNFFFACPLGVAVKHRRASPNGMIRPASSAAPRQKQAVRSPRPKPSQKHPGPVAQSITANQCQAATATLRCPLSCQPGEPLSQPPKPCRTGLWGPVSVLSGKRQHPERLSAPARVSFFVPVPELNLNLPDSTDSACSY